MPLEFPMTFQSWAGPSLKMNWLKKLHGYHIINHAMYTLLPTLRGDLHLPPEDILRRVDKQPDSILLHIHLDMK